MIRNPFPCTQCGLCCEHVYLSKETLYLDRGDGKCRHYSDISRLCLVYENRPEICCIDTQYRKYYSDKYSWPLFVEKNLEVCRLLQGQAKELKQDHD